VKYFSGILSFIIFLAMVWIAFFAHSLEFQQRFDYIEFGFIFLAVISGLVLYYEIIPQIYDTLFIQKDPAAAKPFFKKFFLQIISLGLYIFILNYMGDAQQEKTRIQYITEMNKKANEIFLENLAVQRLLGK